MCGIIASFAYGAEAPPVDMALLERLRDRMASRGPDGAGSWRSSGGSVGLGHRRLAIIDPSPAGAQPMLLEEAGLALVFNGEIYNYRELRRELTALGHAFRTHSDTEVILRAYLAYGPAAVARLRGMFAFALWDERKHGLLLARDPLGIKPLYVADDGKRLWAASQASVLAEALAGKDADAAAQLSFLLNGYVVEPLTMFRDIRALPAGHWQWHGGSAPKTQRYFDLHALMLEAEGKAKEATRHSREAELQLLASALTGSVRAHLVADVPVGLYLSSGIDSTAIATLAARAKSDIHALTIGADKFAGTEEDEVPLAVEVARALGLKHEVRTLCARNLDAEFDAILAAMDQPSIDGANAFLVSGAARQAGFKVALSGLGGDELFGGYPSFRQVPAMRRLAAPFAAAPGIGRGLRKLLAPPLARFTSPKYASLVEYGGDESAAYFLRRALFLPWEVARKSDPVLAARLWDELSALVLDRAETAGLRSDRLKVTALEVARYMKNQLLRDSDWAGMAHGIEIRTPFADSALLTALLPLLASSAPPSKASMTNAINPPLRDRLVARPKTGFGLPIRRWLMESRNISDRSLRGWGKLVYREWCKAHRVEAVFSV